MASLDGGRGLSPRALEAVSFDGIASLLQLHCRAPKPSRLEGRRSPVPRTEMVNDKMLQAYAYDIAAMLARDC